MRCNQLIGRIGAIVIVLVACVGLARPARAELAYKFLTIESGARIIVVTGQFTYGERLDAFAEMVRTNRPEIVTFDSGGGSIYKAMELGRLIRHYELNTVMVDGMRCVSACTMAFLGGVKRGAAAGSIGVHKSTINVKDMEDPKKLVSGMQSIIADMMSYVKEMGANIDLIKLSLETDADDMRYLSRYEMASFGVTNIVESPPDGAQPAPKYDAPTSAQQPKISRLQQQSIEFIVALYRNMSRPTDQVLGTIDNLYAETVSYFGDDLSREEVAARIGVFYARWPIRQYTPKGDSIKIDCDDASLICSVSGELQFDAQSPDRNQHSIGVATFEYSISFDNPRKIPKIVAENGRTLQRNITQLFAQQTTFH